MDELCNAGGRAIKNPMRWWLVLSKSTPLFLLFSTQTLCNCLFVLCTYYAIKMAIQFPSSDPLGSPGRLWGSLCCLTRQTPIYQAPLTAEWIFRCRFSLHAWILQGFSREFCCGFLCGFSVLRFNGRKAPKNPQKNSHKYPWQIHALRMKIHQDECSAEGQSWHLTKATVWEVLGNWQGHFWGILASWVKLPKASGNLTPSSDAWQMSPNLAWL